MKSIRILTAAIVAATVCGAPAPAEAASVTWSTPPSERVIEVVDAIEPTAWRVGSAITWLDHYTASDMRLVGRCSGKAYRCITVRQGKVSAAAIGWSSGSTVTIDTTKAASKKYRAWYRYDRNRTWLLIHELSHQHGLGHSTGRNVMNPAVNRYRLVFTAGQKKALRAK